MTEHTSLAKQWPNLTARAASHDVEHRTPQSSYDATHPDEPQLEEHPLSHAMRKHPGPSLNGATLLEVHTGY